ncbi:hypothetical protein PRZ48_008608 [Zasmidium cellare]|uniref:Telomerase reverse transcriptase n=1 Tax=Zasmidium cellare TaxID=395010 RepID=A0ABR0EFX9_ZASCE|nr:hypothetical protein PRZ48_008608 [Zasmidium cellare]
MKRKRPTRPSESSIKKQRTDSNAAQRPSYPLLQKYYRQVVTLRQYLASRLSRKRRKRLQQYGRKDGDESISHLLDTTLIGTFGHAQVEDSSFVGDDLTIFTQQLSNSDSSIALTPGSFKQTEILDFVIWLLFRRSVGVQRPKHILCQNFQRYITEHNYGPEPEIVPGIPGIYSVGPNEHVQTLRGHPWTFIPDLLGKGSERLIGDLLMDCGVFTPVGKSSNLIQLSGIPMCDLPIFRPEQDTHEPNDPAVGEQRDGPSKRGLADIRIVRHRMLYARAALNARGGTRFGLNQIHVLNRCRDIDSAEDTVHVMKYIFPAQFRLHNVLQSNVDNKDTTDPFRDYMLREQEISLQQKARLNAKKAVVASGHHRPPSTPKRLRGTIQTLVRRLRKRHSTCSYFAMLEHYCPRPSAGSGSADASIQLATDESNVSAFCRAAVFKVFPKALWGDGETGQHNARKVYQNIDRFVRLRRYESMSLHDVLQGMRLHDIGWLRSPKLDAGHSLSKTDYDKRKELMVELLYYLFDSFLIPLIRGHFHVTESNVHRNQLFYFRQDIWKQMSEPALNELKNDMLEECSPLAVDDLLARRALGVSHVRMLPKEHGMRPIINLRRRVQKLQRGKMVLGRSINSLMTPAFSVLNFEKTIHSKMLGSALFSIDDIFPRLQAYRRSLVQRGLKDKPLYFAKVDVQACFDTIPQERLLQLMENIINGDQYQVAKYSRAKLAGGHNKDTPGFSAKPTWKFLTKAVANDQHFDFQGEVKADVVEGRKGTVYVNGVNQRRETKQMVLSLLEEHVQTNLIKVGKRFYRQKKGIPQGSIVSSLLCSYFYAELERKYLGFIDDQSLLLRLIDDFLVISTERNVVERFMKTMHAGIPEFGVNIKAAKSRANFDVEVGGQSIEKVTDRDFPYCGNAIDTITLDLAKDKERRRKSNIADAVTVEYSKLPGQSFYRKTLNALKLQMHAMLLSTSYNSIDTVLSNLYHAFTEVAQKSYHYVKSLPSTQQPASKLMISKWFDPIHHPNIKTFSMR